MITLKTLPQATDQEVFDQVKTHLLSQGKKSLKPGKRTVSLNCLCSYHSKDGLKCAAGCLIGEDEYDPAFEGFSWKSLMYSWSVPKEHCSLITELQVVHDTKEPEQWEEALKNVAWMFGLDFDHA